MTHAVMKLLWLLLLLMLLLLQGQAVLVIALKLLQSPAAAVLIIALKLLQSLTAAAQKNSYVFGNVIVPRGIILSMLQIINRTIRLN